MILLLCCRLDSYEEAQKSLAIPERGINTHSYSCLDISGEEYELIVSSRSNAHILIVSLMQFVSILDLIIYLARKINRLKKYQLLKLYNAA